MDEQLLIFPGNFLQHRYTLLNWTSFWATRLVRNESNVWLMYKNIIKLWECKSLCPDIIGRPSICVGWQKIWSYIAITAAPIWELRSILIKQWPYRGRECSVRGRLANDGTSSNIDEDNRFSWNWFISPRYRPTHCAGYLAIMEQNVITLVAFVMMRSLQVDHTHTQGDQETSEWW